MALSRGLNYLLSPVEPFKVEEAYFAAIEGTPNLVFFVSERFDLFDC